MKNGRWVYHLAGNPNLWVKDRNEFEAVNHQGTVNVLESALEAGAERVLHTSTESILTRPHARGIIDENVVVSEPDTVGPYCLSKLRAEAAAMKLAKAGWPVVVANPTMPVGPGDRGLSPPTRLIRDFCCGNLPALMDCTLNMVDVRDVATGLIRVFERGRPGQRYLLGGENLTLASFLNLLSGFCGVPVPRWRVPYIAGLAVAYISEFWSDHVTGVPPKATVTGVRLRAGSCILIVRAPSRNSSFHRGRFAKRSPMRCAGCVIPDGSRPDRSADSSHVKESRIQSGQNNES